MSDNSDIMTTVMNAIDQILAPMEDGSKTTVRDCIDKVVAKTGVKVSIANGIVPLLLQQLQTEGKVEVWRGRSGGVFKSGRKQRVDMRPRCEACHQVLRPIGKSKTEE